MSVINQRSMDILQLEAELYIQDILTEFEQEFLGDRLDTGAEGEEDAFTESEEQGEDELGAEDARDAEPEAAGLEEPLTRKGRDVRGAQALRRAR